MCINVVNNISGCIPCRLYCKICSDFFFFGYNVLPNSVEVFTIRVYSHTQAGRLIHKFFPSNVLDESDKMFEFKPLREAFLLSVEG